MGNSAPAVCTVTTSPEVPEKPEPVKLVSSLANTLVVTCKAPCDRGSPITGYTFRVRSALDVFYFKHSGNASDSLECELEGFEPEFKYDVCVLAVNGVGDSEYSEAQQFTTGPPTLPEAPKWPAVTLHGTLATTYDALVWWEQPRCEGADHRQLDCPLLTPGCSLLNIRSFRVEYRKAGATKGDHRIVSREESEALYTQEQPEAGEDRYACRLSDLMPNTMYSVTVETQNVAGLGTKSSVIQFSTLRASVPGQVEGVTFDKVLVCFMSLQLILNHQY